MYNVCTAARFVNLACVSIHCMRAASFDWLTTSPPAAREYRLTDCLKLQIGKRCACFCARADCYVMLDGVIADCEKWRIISLLSTPSLRFRC